MRRNIIMINCRIVALTLLSFLLLSTSCVEVHQKIFLNKDGSGSAKMEFVIHKELAAMGLAELKEKLKQDAPKGWSFHSEREVGNNFILTYQAAFQNISTLNDDEIQYSFVRKNKNLFEEMFQVKINFLKNRVEPIPFHLLLEMPAPVSQTNGAKVSASQVKWEFSGLKKGNELLAESSSINIGFVVVLIILGLLIVALFLFFILKQQRAISSIPQKARKSYCIQCGATLSIEAKFCENCGEKVSIK